MVPNAPEVANVFSNFGGVFFSFQQGQWTKNPGCLNYCLGNYITPPKTNMVHLKIPPKGKGEKPPNFWVLAVNLFKGVRVFKSFVFLTNQ